ncbi:MAG: hypothetical protein E7487_07780 [Ruminococcaceae bacterium]|nr:hypothetical protein [Oscillospiraceae bacterium]
MMKIKLLLLLSFLLIFTLFPACTPQTNLTEALAPDLSMPSVDIDSFETLCSYSNTIVKASYIDCEPFEDSTSVYRFRLEKDYIGNLDEKTLHVYGTGGSVLIPGKSYWLFLTGTRSPVYPHTVFGRIQNHFLMGEANGQLTFYGGNTLGLQDLEDIDGYIEQIVAAGGYSTEGMDSQPPEEAARNADRILLVTVTETTPKNKYLAVCSYEIEKVLKGPETLPSSLSSEDSLSKDVRLAAGTDIEEYFIPAPADTKVGDKLLLLFRLNPDNGHYEIYSTENYLISADSKEGKALLSDFTPINK